MSRARRHAGRRLPRALTPFRHPAYRRLAVALVALHLRLRRLGRRPGLGGHPDRRRPGPALGRLDRRRRRRPAARRCSAAWSPTGSRRS